MSFFKKRKEKSISMESNIAKSNQIKGLDKEISKSQSKKPANKASEPLKSENKKVILNHVKSASKKAAAEAVKATPKKAVAKVVKATPKKVAAKSVKAAPKKVTAKVVKAAPKAVKSSAKVVKAAPKKVAANSVKLAPKAVKSAAKVVKAAPKKVAAKVVKATPKKVAAKVVKATPKKAVKATPKKVAAKVVKATPKKVATKAVKATPKKAVKATPKKVATKAVKTTPKKAVAKVVKAVAVKAITGRTKSPSEILLSKPIDTNLVIVTKVKPITQIAVSKKSIFDGPGEMLTTNSKIKNKENKKINKVKTNKIMKSKPLTSKEIKDFKKIIESKLKISNAKLVSIIERRKKLESDLLDPDHKKLNQENGMTNDSYFYDISIELTNANQIIFDCEEALDAIKNKTFGVCVKCKNPISRKRLEVRETSLYCVECKPVINIDNNNNSLEEVLTEGFSESEEADELDEDEIEVAIEK